MPRAIGLMSGTSLDGVDAAWLETDGHAITAFGPSLTIPYDRSLKHDLRRILDTAPTLEPDDAGLRDAVARLTEYHMQAVVALDRPADVIGFHGQTILHQPHLRRTWQVGDAQALADRTGIPVVFDFRAADVAAGGQGAPLAPVYHAALARELSGPVAIVNIGGVANVTWIGRDGFLLAFDTGPGNGPLDDWSVRHLGKPYDQDGALARSGQPDRAVLRRLLSHPYFDRLPPKSLDRLDFALVLDQSGLQALSPADGAATLTAFTIAAIARSDFPDTPSRWLVCGGGRHNRAIIDGLRQAVKAPVDPVEVLGWDGDALEAQCFGFLAVRVLAGLPISLPETTGVPSPMTGGRIVAPKC